VSNGRPEVRDSKPVAERLRKLRDENLADIDKLIAEENKFDRDFCRRYYREYLRFSFGEKEKAGLREFNRRCREQRLLPLEQLEADSRAVDLPLRCV
jgi:predicted solute-binding protein